jgi:hypothetical protein
MQRFVPVEDLFKGRHFDGQIIILCVAWYSSFKLSLRDLVIMMADRGISVTHTTILRWVQRYLPEFEKRWWRYARPVGGSWRMDEPYIKVHGQWVYLYRATLCGLLRGMRQTRPQIGSSTGLVASGPDQSVSGPIRVDRAAFASMSEKSLKASTAFDFR